MRQLLEKRSFTHAPKAWATMLFFAGLAVFYVLFLGRKPSRFRSDSIIELAPDFYTHASNLSLSYLLVTGIGYVWLMTGSSRRHIALLVGTLVVANVAVEGVVSILNVPDWTDAWFGVAGSVTGAAVLFVIHRWGLRPAAS